MSEQHARFLAERAIRAEHRTHIGEDKRCVACGKPHPLKMSGLRCRLCKINFVRPKSWGPDPFLAAGR